MFPDALFQQSAHARGCCPRIDLFRIDLFRIAVSSLTACYSLFRSQHSSSFQASAPEPAPLPKNSSVSSSGGQAAAKEFLQPRSSAHLPSQTANNSPARLAKAGAAQSRSLTTSSLQKRRQNASNVQCPMSNVPAHGRDFGLWTLDFGLPYPRSARSNTAA